MNLGLMKPPGAEQAGEAPVWAPCWHLDTRRAAQPCQRCACSAAWTAKSHALRVTLLKSRATYFFQETNQKAN